MTPSDCIRRRHAVLYVLLGVVLATMLGGYRLMLFEHLPFYFNDPHEDLSYAWFVPFFSLYVVWRERRELAESLGEPSAWGFLPLLPSLFLGYIGARGGQVRFEIVGFIGTLGSLVWIFFGLKALKRLAFPLAFLLFCLPLHSFLDLITIHLRSLAGGVSYAVMRGVGVEVVRQGTMLFQPDGFQIDVADPCSGLRSLFAMMALTAGYAYFNLPTWPRRFALFALSVPIAVFGNVCRILSIVFTAAFCSADFATGFYHDYSGYVVFLVAISLMVACGSWLAPNRAETPAKTTSGRQQEPSAE